MKMMVKTRRRVRPVSVAKLMCLVGDVHQALMGCDVSLFLFLHHLLAVKSCCCCCCCPVSPVSANV